MEEKIGILCPEATLQVGISRTNDTLPFWVCPHSSHHGAYVLVPVPKVARLLNAGVSVYDAIAILRADLGAQLVEQRAYDKAHGEDHDASCSHAG
jgi:hypothetical protein